MLGFEEVPWMGSTENQRNDARKPDSAPCQVLDHAVDRRGSRSLLNAMRRGALTPLGVAAWRSFGCDCRGPNLAGEPL